MQEILVWNQDHTRREWKKVPTGKFKFTEEDRIAIVAEYVSGHVPASQIVEKYHLSSRQMVASQFVCLIKVCYLCESQSDLHHVRTFKGR